MLYFLDTSALVKRYHLELGSPVVIGVGVRSGLLRAAEACGLSTLNPLSPT